eukprot:1188521-Pleurochrysis_carterae.AAC.1
MRPPLRNARPRADASARLLAKAGAFESLAFLVELLAVTSIKLLCVTPDLLDSSPNLLDLSPNLLDFAIE